MWNDFVRLRLAKRLSFRFRSDKMSTSVNRREIKLKSTGSASSGFVEETEVEGFRVNRVERINDFDCNLIQLRHIDTGAEYIHVDKNDANNVFGIAFRTTPFNSTGLPHILEHITLCGSHKYPVRDPFFKMLNRSLATYLNASTAPDCTVYPFSTQNRIDYYNLMSVYLDAVFKPLLRESDFRQEGWRLEHEDVSDPQSKIVFKGVVFNEMKGVFSENDNIFMESLLNNLLPSHTYRFNSGGDPLLIPELRHDDLIDFHKRHYHPSNSRIYSYGNFDLRDHLKFINDAYLRQYEANPDYREKTRVPLEARWSEPRRAHISGRSDPLAPDPEKQSMLAVAYSCEDIRRVEDNFVLGVIGKLLLDGPNSPFYKSLIESGIGTGYAPGTGFDSQTRNTLLSVGLQGVASTDLDSVQQIISDTLNRAAIEGFEEKNIENVLHGIELNIRHQRSNFGLNLLYAITSLWNHDGDVVESLRISEHVNSLRGRDDTSRHLRECVQRYFCDNQHRLILTMSPDERYETSVKAKEAECLNRKLSGLSPDEKRRIYENGLQLRAEQEKTENVDCLPTLKLSNIGRSVESEFFDLASHDNVPVQRYVLPTNGVSYFNAVIDTSDMSEESKSLLPLFCDIVCEMGTQRNDYRTFDQLVNLKTGGLYVSTHVAEHVDDCRSFEDGVHFSSHCLDRNVDGMFDLWFEIFNQTRLDDVNRFSTLVRELSCDLLTGIADSGHTYAMSCASAMLNPSARRKETFSGLAYVFKMKEIARMKDLSAILAQMEETRDRVLRKTSLRCSINTSSESECAASSSLFRMIESVPGRRGNPVSTNGRDKSVEANDDGSLRKHYVFPFAVNYTAKSLPAVAYNDGDFARLKILCRLLQNKYLLPLVREKFGAYGAGAKVTPDGVIQLYSYRDPNSVGTLEIFDGAAEWIRKNQFTDKDIDEAKLGTFQSVDMPIPPSGRGLRSFLYRISDEDFSAYRTNLLNVTRECILNASEKYLTSNNSAYCILGPDSNDVTSSSSSWIKIE